MKNRANKEFRQFRVKILFLTVTLLLIAVVFIYAIYSFVLHGNFANWTVALFQRIFLMDYEAAYKFYQQTFRNHMDFFILLSIVAVFALTFHVYLGWFTGYFAQINRGMDALIQEKAMEISLPGELYSIERKMNAAKHTIERQKQDMRIAEQRKNDLVMYLAHDLKTPLASVISYLSLLRDQGQIPEELREKYLSISLDKAQHLEELINEFFEIAKFSLSDVTLQYSRINLTRLLEQLIYEFRPMLDDKKLECRLCMDEEVMLKCDAGKIQRVFENLLRNAVTYSYQGTEIHILADCHEDSLVIRLENHGSTIPEEKLERIFEQFYRLDGGRSTAGAGGAGLGLAIARQIVTLHGGTITAKSEDERTSFLITLPVL